MTQLQSIHDGLVNLLDFYYPLWPWILGVDLVLTGILGIAIALKATEK